MDELKILLVDDEQEFVTTLAERLEIRNMNVSVAMDGMELLRRTKKAFPGVQIVMLTGHGSEKDEQEARRLGAFEYLKKPVSIGELMKAVSAAYQSKFEDTMTAAAFAEAGDFETARSISKSK
jgi:DNA-binding response OmpR family regulator